MARSASRRPGRSRPRARDEGSRPPTDPGPPRPARPAARRDATGPAARSPRQDRGHPPADVPDIRGPFAEVVVVDRGEDVGLLGCRRGDRLAGGRARLDQGEGRPDDAGVAREQRLRLEDGADLLAGTGRGLDGQRLELGRAAVERGASRACSGRRVGRGRSRRGPAATTWAMTADDRAARPTPTPGEPARPIRIVAPWRGPEPGSCGQPASELGAGRAASAVASASARSRSAADVAPGSWWPIDRSPRYDARPLVASIGTVASGAGLGGLGHRDGHLGGAFCAAPLRSARLRRPARARRAWSSRRLSPCPAAGSRRSRRPGRRPGPRPRRRRLPTPPTAPPARIRAVPYSGRPHHRPC